MKKTAIAAVGLAVALTSVSYATIHSKPAQPRTEPASTVALASVGGLSAADDDVRLIRASRSRHPAPKPHHLGQAHPLVTKVIPVTSRPVRPLTPVALSKMATRRVTSPSGTGVWYRLVQCEAGGDWQYGGPGGHTDSGYNFEGGPNFTHGTWVSYGGRAFAEHAWGASPSEQIIIAKRVLRGQGVHAWPQCGPRVGLTMADAN